MGYRCITKEECKNLNINKTSELPYIASLGHCLEGCRPDFQIKYAIEGNKMSASCVRCKGRDCWKRCEAPVIDSVEAARKLKGCQLITGSLEIQLKPTSNAMKELKSSLSDIIEIADYLKISRSPCITSLSFFTNLKKISGESLASGKYSVVMFDNSNLRSLFDENQEVQIEKGKVFFHFNPSLCFSRIVKIAKSNEMIENYDEAKISNGDKVYCDETSKVNTQVIDVSSNDALIHWSSVDLDNGSFVLSYVIFYKETALTEEAQEESDVCGSDE